MKRQKEEYAGFWIRVVASLIDGVILGLVARLIFYLLVYTSLSLFRIILVYGSLALLLDLAYESYLTSRYGWTIGKYLIKCRVRGEDGKNLSLGRSIGRYFAKILSVIPLGFGYFMIGWDSQKRGIHDKIVKSFVVHDPKSTLREWIKKTLIVLAIVTAVLYVVFVIAMAVEGVKLGIQSAKMELNVNTAVVEINAFCSGQPLVARDSCRVVLLKKGYPVSALDTRSMLSICSQIRSTSVQEQCVSHVATTKKNESVCNQSRSAWYKRYCAKTYEFWDALRVFFLTDQQLGFSGNLTLGSANLGLVSGDGRDCVGDNRQRAFTGKDTICLIPFNVTGFERGPDRLNWFDMDVRIANSDGLLVRYSPNIFDEEGHVLLNNDTLNGYWVSSGLSTLPPGDYTYELTIRDRVTNKGVVVKRPFVLTE